MENLSISKDNLTETVESLVNNILVTELFNRNQNVQNQYINSILKTQYGPLTFLSQNSENGQESNGPINKLISYITQKGSAFLSKFNIDTIVKALKSYQQQGGQENSTQSVIRENVEKIIKEVL